MLDVDGTLSDRDRPIRVAVREALTAAGQRGVVVGLATARLYRSALPYHRAIGARAPLICCQGALVKDPATRRVHRHWALPQPFAAGLLDRLRLRRWRDLSVHLHCQDRLYVRGIDAQTRGWLAGSRIAATPVGSLRRVAHLAPTKIAVIGEYPARIDELETDLRARFGSAEVGFSRPAAHCLEAANPRADKARAVRYVAEDLLGLDRNQVMAVGDSTADQPMLAYAGVGVAMGNAPAALRAAADWVAPPVGADGAAAAVRRWIL